MNLRLYIRGLGIGILVTAAILIMTAPETVAMTDDEIKDRARMLGMSENVVLTQLAPPGETDPEKDKITDEDIILDDISTDSDSDTEIDINELDTDNDPDNDFNTSAGIDGLLNNLDGDISNTDIANNDTTNTETDNNITDVDTDNTTTDIPPEPGELITIRINSGDDSFRVSSRLAEAGLVNSATEYNNYLMEHGHSRRLRVGDHKIPAGADYSTIALILTGRG